MRRQEWVAWSAHANLENASYNEWFLNFTDDILIELPKSNQKDLRKFNKE